MNNIYLFCWYHKLRVNLNNGAGTGTTADQRAILQRGLKGSTTSDWHMFNEKCWARKAAADAYYPAALIYSREQPVTN